MGQAEQRHGLTFKPTWEIGASIGVHVLLFGLVAAGQMWDTDSHMFDPKDVMAVQAVALPKANRRMPDRPTRTPDPPKGETAQSKVPPPPPTASDMALEKKKPAKTKGAPDRSTDRAELLNRIKQEIQSAIGYGGDTVSTQQELAQQYYFSEPFGNEQEVVPTTSALMFRIPSNG